MSGRCPVGSHWDENIKDCVQDIQQNIIVKSGNRGSFIVNIIAILIGFAFIWFSLWTNMLYLVGLLVLIAILFAYSPWAAGCLILGIVIGAVIKIAGFMSGLHLPFMAIDYNNLSFISMVYYNWMPILGV